MVTVIVTGLQRRARVVSLMTLVRDYAGLGLKAAKEAVERVFGGDRLELSVASTEAVAFADAARALGAVVEVIPASS